MPTVETIEQNYQQELRKRNKYLEEYPEAITFFINDTQDRLECRGGAIYWERLKDIEFLNFCCAGAIPEKDQELEKLIKKYRAIDWNEGKPGLRAGRLITKVFKRIEELNGITFNWI